MSDTAELAALVGVAPDVLVRALGDAWTEVPGPPHERWFVSGEPAQVAVGWDGFGFTLARPEPRWSGPAELVWEFVADRRFSSDEVLYERAALAEAAEEVARKRRRTFRWCPVCRQVNAREHVHDNTGLCMACAERYLGIQH